MYSSIFFVKKSSNIYRIWKRRGCCKCAQKPNCRIKFFQAYGKFLMKRTAINYFDNKNLVFVVDIFLGNLIYVINMKTKFSLILPVYNLIQIYISAEKIAYTQVYWTSRQSECRKKSLFYCKQSAKISS